MSFQSIWSRWINITFWLHAFITCQASSLQIFISKSNTLDMDMTFALNKMNTLNMDMTCALYHYCWASRLDQHLSRASTYWKSESPWVISGDSLIILQHSNATFDTETSCGKILAEHHTGKKNIKFKKEISQNSLELCCTLYSGFLPPSETI